MHEFKLEILAGIFLKQIFVHSWKKNWLLTGKFFSFTKAEFSTKPLIQNQKK